ncbi:MAG: hypothetical protein PHH70_00690 [Candidatus Gracilibacteria bacterium]|nr:hypothetical protein [Candidatus Gracilibacteria bacterium]
MPDKMVAGDSDESPIENTQGEFPIERTEDNPPIEGTEDDPLIEDTDDESLIKKTNREERLRKKISPIIPKSSKGLFAFFDAAVREAQSLHNKDAVVEALRFSAMDPIYDSKAIFQEYGIKKYWNNGQKWDLSSNADYVGLVIYHSLFVEGWFPDSREKFEKVFEFMIPKVLSQLSPGSMEQVMINLYKEKEEQRKRREATTLIAENSNSPNNKIKLDDIEEIMEEKVDTGSEEFNSGDLEEIEFPREISESEYREIMEEVDGPEFDISIDDAPHLIAELKETPIHEIIPLGQVSINLASPTHAMNIPSVATLVGTD